MKKKILWQFFTKQEIAWNLIDLILSKFKLNSISNILEPSSWTKSFVNELNKRWFKNIKEYEIDWNLTKNPKNFLETIIKEKFNLIIWNPPYSKIHSKETFVIYKWKRMKIEQAFILKSLNLLSNDWWFWFILPINFFTNNKNIKNLILSKFNTIYIYQDDTPWFNENINSAFIFCHNSNNPWINLIYKEIFTHKINKDEFIEKALPVYYFNKNKYKDISNIKLWNFIKKVSKSVNINYKNKNLSSKELVNRKININDWDNYSIAIARVWMWIVWKCGLINSKDIINEVFYVYELKKEYSSHKNAILIQEYIRKNRQYFLDISIWTWSPSIGNKDILDLPINIEIKWS